MHKLCVMGTLWVDIFEYCVDISVCECVASNDASNGTSNLTCFGTLSIRCVGDGDDAPSVNDGINCSYVD